MASVAGAVLAAGCTPHSTGPNTRHDGLLMHAISLSDQAPMPAGDESKVVLISSAKNEWVSFALQIDSLPASAGFALRLQAPQLQSANATISANNFAVYQILPMPVDVNRASYVRHTGLDAAARELPRALLPQPVDNGTVNLRTLRDPKQATKPAAFRTGPATVQIWVDLRIPSDAKPGDYACTCDLMDGRSARPAASVPVKIKVYDFALPEQRHLQMVGRLRWEDLERLYPGFETVRPRLLNRKEPKYAPAIATLDGIIALAQAHRTDVTVSRLQPTVKWPVNQPPQIDWTDFDSVVTPWVKGTPFADHQALKFWPLPAPDYLDRYDRKSQLDYWALAASHFQQNDWLENSAVWLEKQTPGFVSYADSAELSTMAAETLRAHPKVRVMVPLEDDQLQLAGTGAGDAKAIDPETTPRIWAAGKGLVFPPPRQEWPADAKRPGHWLRTDLPGLVPYVGAGGDEHDVRLWAWLAFLRDAGAIVWKGALPTLDDPSKPADPNELIWFYPGHWFGIDQPVPTVQLKWLRRAQQDYEYLYLARERGEVLNALVMARLITKPVEIQPGQPPDPSYALMCGTSDKHAWADAKRLLAESILLRRPGEEPDSQKQHALYIETLRWSEPQERPLLMGRTTHWALDRANPSWLTLRLGLDTYNASDNTPDQNLLQWTALPQGWQVQPQPMQVPALHTYHVRRDQMDARFDLTKVSAAARQPVELTFTNGFNKRVSGLKMVLPVGVCDRREGSRFALDGSLSDWTEVDAIQDGPLVKMLSRPNVQRQEMQLSPTRSKIFTGWANERFYVAFELDGLSAGGAGKAQNFVDYQSQRAWGEDLCEILIQPVDPKSKAVPVLHVVCKPNGSVWVERKLDPERNANPWQPIAGADIRYATQPQGTSWRGEVAIPWRTIVANFEGLAPPLIRFNFVQHKTSTGESASWCGPVDFGRDDSFMGVLLLRDPNSPGMGDVTQGQ